MVPNLVTHYYAAVLDGIEDEARRAGYSVISANSHENFEDEALAVDNFIGLHVEGIIACLAQTTTDYRHYEEIASMGIPLVFFGRTCLTDRFSCVTANGDEAAQQATLHLIDTGSRRIAFIGGPNHLDMVRRRKHGYLEALRERGIPIDRNLVVCDKIDYQVALESTKRLLSQPSRPDAILAFNDIITFAAFTAIMSVASAYLRTWRSSALLTMPMQPTSLLACQPSKTSLTVWVSLLASFCSRASMATPRCTRK